MITQEFLLPRIGDIHILEYNQNPGNITISEIFGVTDHGTVSFKLFNRVRTAPWTGGSAVHNTALVANSVGVIQSSGFNDNKLGSREVLVLEITDITLAPTKMFVAVTGDI